MGAIAICTVDGRFDELDQSRELFQLESIVIPLAQGLDSELMQLDPLCAEERALHCHRRGWRRPVGRGARQAGDCRSTADRAKLDRLGVLLQAGTKR